MNIIIVGSGEIGTHIALSLAEESHAITVIEADEQIAEELGKRLDARVMVGDGSSLNTLIEANIGECDLFLALTSDNNVNLVSSSLAKRLGAEKTLCRVHPGVERESFLVDIGQHFGVDYLFSSERLAAVELAKYVLNPHAILVEEIAQGHVELQQVKVTHQSKMIGIPLKELDFPNRVRIGTILRGERSFIPSAADAIEGGDIVTFFGEPAKLYEVTQRLRNRSVREDRANVVIFGGGEYGYSLAQTLASRNCSIRIFETDRARCEELKDQLTNATVLNTDATSLSELKEEQVGDADFFIAVTDVDEDNVMTCLQAHSLGTRHCLTLIHRADYADAIMGFGDQMGILAAISPRQATRRDISRFLISDRFHLLQKLEGADLIEVAVSENAPVAGKLVKEIEWPEGCILVAFQKGTSAQVPAADDEVKEGGNIYAVVNAKAKRKFLKLVSG